MGTVIQIRKVMRTSIRICCSSIVRHPFLVAIMCFLFLLYRTFPVLFTILVSVSPVLVCTSVLLGVLLSFGESNIPEIETEEKERSHLKTEVSEDETFPYKDRDFVVEEHSGEGKVVGENVDEDKGLREHNASKFEFLKGLDDVDDDKELGEHKVSRGEVLKGLDDDHIPLIGETSREIKCEKCMREEMVEGVRELELEDVRKMMVKSGEGSEYSEEEVSERGYSLVPKSEMDAFGLENEKLLGEFVDHDGLVPRLDHALLLEEVNHNGHEDDGESSVSGSEDGDDDDDDEDDDDDDDDESSDSGSDGAESSSPDASLADIIPMLNELHPLLDVDSPQPAEEDSDANVVESDEDSDAVEGNGEGEEEAQGHKGESDKPVITWTEDDQKNLMNLGTSELERNQRLENLIARRRARKNMRLMAEKNLIDLESVDLPFNNISSISVARRNPFDVPYDSYDGPDLPPIPGSAPSILLPRRNPFDLPYDSSEEKPDLMGDSFQEEFTTPQQKDMSFRRFESFSVGPSRFVGPRQETLDMRWKPYFVPERLASEVTSYPPYLRQLSEVSESKASSVPETESVCSAADAEDKKISEYNTLHETEIISVMERDPNHVESSISGYQSATEAVEVVSDESSLSSPSLWVNTVHDEIEMNMGQDMESYEEVETRSSGAVELNRSEIDLNADDIDRDSERSSLSSSLSEAQRDIAEVSGQSLSLVVNDDVVEVPGNPGQSSLNEANSMASGNPLYDASPQAVEKYLSFSSTSSSQLEFSEVGSPLLSSESDSPSVHKGVESQNESTDVVSANDVPNLGSSLVFGADKIKLVSGEITVTNEHHFTHYGSPIYSQNSGDVSSSLVIESVVEHKLNDSRAPPLGSTEQFDNHQNILQEEPSVVGMSSEKLSPTSSDVNMSSHSLKDKIFRDISASITFEEPKAEFSERVILGEPVFDKIDKDHQILELEEINERKEIYGLFAELDAIGDFSVVNPGKTDLNLHVMEVNSLEDIHATLEEVSEGDQDKQLISEAVNLKSIEIERNEDSFSNKNDFSREKSSIQGTSSSVDPQEKDTGLRFVEERPCQDVIMSQKEIAEANQEKLPTSIGFSRKPVDIERSIDSSHKASESSSEKSSVQGTSSGVDPQETGLGLHVVVERPHDNVIMSQKEIIKANPKKQLTSTEFVSGKPINVERSMDSSSKTSELSSERSSFQGTSSGVGSGKTEVDLRSVKARSLDDISMTSEKLMEGTQDKLLIAVETVSETSIELERDIDSSFRTLEPSCERSSCPGTTSSALGISHEKVGEISKFQPSDMKEKLEGGEDGQPVSLESASRSANMQGEGEISSKNLGSDKSYVPGTSSGSSAAEEPLKKGTREVKEVYKDNEENELVPIKQVGEESDKIQGNEGSSSNSITVSTEKPVAQLTTSGTLRIGEASKEKAPETKELLEDNQKKKLVFIEHVSGESNKTQGKEKSFLAGINLISEESSAHTVSSGALEVGETSKKQVPKVMVNFEGNQEKLLLPVEQISGELNNIKVNEESSSKKIELSGEKSSYQEAISAADAVGEKSKIASELKEKLDENQDKQTPLVEQVIGESVKVERNGESSSRKTESSSDKSVNQTDSGEAVSLHTENDGKSKNSGLTNDVKETNIA